jgi:hypothetical protein
MGVLENTRHNYFPLFNFSRRLGSATRLFLLRFFLGSFFLGRHS